MADQKTYFQTDILNRPLQKHGLLEEFNLPPRVIALIRQHKRHIVAVLCCLALALVGWSLYQQYRHKQEDQAATKLAEAMGQTDVQKRQGLLEEVRASYGRTGAATWALLELAHLDRDAGRFDQALAKYQQVQASLSSSSPIKPLVQLSVAEALEAKRSFNEALAAYQKLAEIKGFDAQSYLAMARIHEQQGALDKAREMYNRVLPLEEVDNATKELVKGRLARM